MITEQLRTHPLCQGLSEAQIATLAAVAEPVELAQGQLLFVAGAPAAHLYLMVSGRVRLELAPGDRAPLILQTLGAGELLGLSWLAERPRWQWDARAAIGSHLVGFTVGDLRRLWAADHELERVMMEHIAVALAERLQAARLQLADLYRGEW